MTYEIKMTDKNFIVKLSSNSNISFEITPEFCACERPMCLHTRSDGRVFWCCKGYNADATRNKCDLRKDLKCFRCNSGELICKKNSISNEKFYGCTNFSEVSNSACNFTISLQDMDDVIKQVNDTIKFRYNFKTLIYNQADDARWNTYKKNKEKNKASTIKNDCSLERAEEAKKWIDIIKSLFASETKKSSSKKEGTISSKFPIPPQLAKLAVVGLLSLAFFGVVSGSGVKLDLFQGMFTIEVGPSIASSDNVSFAFDSDTGQLIVKNTDSKGSVDLSAIELKDDEGNVLLSFDNLSSEDQILGKGEVMSIDQEELFAMMERNDEYIEYQEEDSDLFDNIFGEYKSISATTDPFDPNRDLPEYVDEREQRIEQFTNALSSQKIEFVVDAVEDGKRVYEEIKMNIRKSAKTKIDRVKGDLEDKRNEIIDHYVKKYGDIPAVIKLRNEYYEGKLTPERIEKLEEEVARLEEILKERRQGKKELSEDELMRIRIERERRLNN